jgi:hypothetical protein
MSCSFQFRKDHIDVIEYLIKTNQLTGESLDDQNRNILFHALPLGNISMIEHLLKSVESFHSLNFRLYRSILLEFTQFRYQFTC